MWLKFGGSSILMKKVITSIAQEFDKENRLFWGVALIQVH